MHLKDYYTILELSPSSSIDEVKKAYRRLAHLYHPDKNESDQYAAAQFAEIKEAYETLTNPVRKEHYLQQRWYAQSTGRLRSQGIIDPVTILKQMLELDKYTHTLDEHRMDKEGLYHYICGILSNDNIQRLNLFREESINKEIIRSALSSGNLVPYLMAIELAERLRKINTDEATQNSIKEFVRHKKQVDYWEKKKIWVVLIIVVVLAVAIFLAAG